MVILTLNRSLAEKRAERSVFQGRFGSFGRISSCMGQLGDEFRLYCSLTGAQVFVWFAAIDTNGHAATHLVILRWSPDKHTYRSSFMPLLSLINSSETVPPLATWQSRICMCLSAHGCVLSVRLCCVYLHMVCLDVFSGVDAVNRPLK